jgi:hypothetical protein
VALAPVVRTMIIRVAVPSPLKTQVVSVVFVAPNSSTNETLRVHVPTTPAVEGTLVGVWNKNGTPVEIPLSLHAPIAVNARTAAQETKLRITHLRD